MLALVAAVVAAAAIVANRGNELERRSKARGHARPADRSTTHGRRRRRLPTPPADVRGAAAQRTAIPILMYHVVSAPKPGTPNAELWVPERAFRDQMAALKRAGYDAITLRQAFEGWHKGGSLPRRPVVVSFDDGYLSQYTHARPILRRLGWPGVLNLKVGNIGPGGLTPREVRALISAGWEIDSHTIDHTDLTADGPEQLRREVVDSRRELRRRFGVRADFFCYPSGRFNEQVIAAVREAGYLGATTTVEGYATRAPMYTLKRVPVNGSESGDDLMQKLAAERPAN
jgi:peptidoglycan/xylan/chitin deacetylase (PgdA/CDA1 family)